MFQEVKIEFYENTSGKFPFLEWFEKIKSKETRAKIKVKLDRVILGNFGNFKSLGQGVFELKIDYGPGYRLYFGRKSSQLVLLLCGGDKSSQKKDIQKAQEYWSDYRKRHET